MKIGDMGKKINYIDISLIERIKQSIDIIDVAKWYLTIDRYGKAICPFHLDKNPSLHFKKNLYHCFGCGVGGDVIDFVRKMESVSFIEAVRALSQIVGIDIYYKEANHGNYQKTKAYINWLEWLEDRFKELENAIYDMKRFEIKCLLPKEERTSKDYLQEQLLEQDLDNLDGLVKKRQSVFEHIKNEVRRRKEI